MNKKIKKQRNKQQPTPDPQETKYPRTKKKNLRKYLLGRAWWHTPLIPVSKKKKKKKRPTKS